jgi:pyruvate dehydrogenase E2 component (dihydrolipoamide acetyltransferase)
MATEIKMPQLSDTMHSGKILSWSKKEGDQVSRGDILAEVETDKANLEIESFHEGVLLKIVVGKDNEANVGQTIAFIGKAGEAIDSVASSATPEQKEKEGLKEKSDEARPEQQREATGPQKSQKDEPTTQEEYIENGARRIKVSPLARKIAEQRNIDLSRIKGSGPEGRIIKKDLSELKEQAYVSTQERQEAAPARKSYPTQATRADLEQATSIPLSKMRQTIARRMQQSVAESPHFYVTVSVNMEEALRLKDLLREQGQEFEKLNVNHLIIKAAGYALRKEPSVNCSFRDDEVYNPGQVNIGIITAVKEGLLIPVIRDVDNLSISDLVFEARAAVDRARAGRPNSSDLSGGTFSISNMGMFDVENFTAIINPGQGAVLAVSAVKETPVVKHGQFVIGQIMKVTLSVDHRIIDGVMGANFLKHFKNGLENPALLLI